MSNLRTTAGNSEAKLKSRDTDNLISGDVLSRIWTEIDLRYADDLVTAKKAVLTISSPQADGQEYAGTFAVSAVTQEDDDLRQATITEILTKITTVTEAANLPTPIELGSKEIQDRFTFQEGTLEGIGYEYRNLDPTARTTLMALDLSSITPAGYEEKERQFSVMDKGDRTGRLSVLFQKTTWITWTGAAADYTILGNIGTDTYGASQGKHREITYVWDGIRVEDSATAAAALRDGTPAPVSGYVVIDVTVRNNGNGSITLIRKDVLRISDYDTSSQQVISPHGFDSGTIDGVQVIFDDFTPDALAAASPTPPENYAKISHETEVKPNGLLKRVYSYELPTWTAWEGQAADYSILGGIGTDSSGTAQGKHRDITYVWTGIQIADSATAAAALRDGTPAPADGYVVMDVTVRDNGNGSVTLIRKDILRISDYDVNAQRVVDPHGFDSGTIDSVRIIFDDFTPVALAAASPTPPDGYTLVSDETEVKANGLLVRVLQYELPTWTAWEGQAADYSILGGIGTDSSGTAQGKHRDITYVWTGIQIADSATAAAALRDGTPAPADGYVVMDVTVRDNGNGSVTLIRRDILRVSDYDVESQQIIDPHGFISGTLDITQIIFDDFTPAALAAASPTPPDGYTKASHVTEIKAGGLLRRVYQYEKPTWTNTGASTSFNIGLSGMDSEKDEDNQIVNLYPAVPLSDVEAAIATLGVNTDNTSYVVERCNVTDLNQGSATITRVRRKKNANSSAGDAYIVERHYNSKGTLVGAVRRWPNLSASDADTLVASLTGSSSFTVDGVTLTNGRVNRIPDNIGLATVQQEGGSAVITGGNRPSYRPIEGLDEDYAEQYFMMDLAGTHWRVTVAKKLFSSRTGANSRLNSSSYNTLWTQSPYPLIARHGNAKTMGRLEFLPNINAWMATTELYEVSTGGSPLTYGDKT